MMSARTAQDFTITKTPSGAVNATQTPYPWAFTSSAPGEPLQYLNRNRFFRPDSGRFISEDPLPERTYKYVRNRPTGFIDPSGMWQYNKGDDCECGTWTIDVEGGAEISYNIMNTGKGMGWKGTAKCDCCKFPKIGGEIGCRLLYGYSSVDIYYVGSFKVTGVCNAQELYSAEWVGVSLQQTAIVARDAEHGTWLLGGAIGLAYDPMMGMGLTADYEGIGLAKCKFY